MSFSNADPVVNTPDPAPCHKIAVVLPPREQFSPDAAGAIGLLAHRLARLNRSDAITIIGAPPSTAPFTDIAFQPVPRCYWPFWHCAGRYAAGAMPIVRHLQPDLIEIHNRPELVRPFAKRFPHIPILLILHNDPAPMREIVAGASAAARIAAVSEWVAARLIEKTGSLRHPPFILPNCIDRASTPTPCPMENRAPTILFAGRIVADKGADLFVRACARALPALQEWRAEMIGADRFGPDSPETPFLRQLRPEADRAGVVLRGYQPHRAVLEAMCRASIIVVPSRWPEPFGLTALEAMACGGALICARTGALPDVVGDGGWLIPAEDDALTESILALARDSCQRQTLSDAGIARARHFDAPEAATRLANLRRETIILGPPP
jgi:UDP-glucose:(glucosyl)LPS alpha-1,2-glucosyltransferase